MQNIKIQIYCILSYGAKHSDLYVPRFRSGYMVSILWQDMKTGLEGSSKMFMIMC